MKHTRIIGYHTTRILSYEKEDIYENGLQPLSKELILRKLNYIKNENLIPVTVYQELLKHNQSEAFNRKNMVWLFHTKDTMQDEGGLNRLLGLYGGESIYWIHSSNPKVIKYLNKIGKPTIVKCSIGFTENNPRYDINARMLKYFALRGNFEDFDSSSKKISSIISIVDFDSKEFEQLTNYSKWRGPL